MPREAALPTIPEEPGPDAPGPSAPPEQQPQPSAATQATPNLPAEVPPEVARRTYLASDRPSTPAPAATAPVSTQWKKVSLDKVLSTSVTVKFGDLLFSLPQDVVAPVLDQFRGVEHVPTSVEIAAAVEAAVLAIDAARPLQPDKAPPENIFAPFRVTTAIPTGFTHWANVDTGAMVNVVHSGVLRAFPELAEFRVDFDHEVRGVGGSRTKVVGKLVGIPVTIGDTGEQEGSPAVPTTFYILQCDDRYHWILGL